jgi:hypothetical protein
VTENTKVWVRSLPLLLMSSFLMLGAAWAFFQGKDNVASIAAFSAGLLLLGAWLATAIIDWHEGHAPVAPTITKEVQDDDTAG